jgi:streptogrisin C
MGSPVFAHVKNRLAVTAVVGALVMSFASFAAYPAQAEPAEPASPSAAPVAGGSSEPRLYESIEYLKTTYHIGTAEARRRLELQAAAAGLADKARAAVGDELLDVRLDQAGGGKLTLLTSEPERARAALGASADAQVRLVRSKFTAAQLEAARHEVSTRLAGVGNATVGLDPWSESIRVHYYTGSGRTDAADVRRRSGSRAAGAVPVQVDIGPRPPKGEQRSCDIMACDTPMRGGLRLHIKRDNGEWGSCTSGFNLRGEGWVYLLTAGHCALLPGPKRQCFYHNGLPVAWEKASSGSESGCRTGTGNTNYAKNVTSAQLIDYAILPFYTEGASWSSYWLTGRSRHNLVQSQCVSPSAKSCTSGTYAISGLYAWNQIQTGWVVCSTGTGTHEVYTKEVPTGYVPGTKCGEISSKTCTDYYTCDPSTYGQGLAVNICTRAGDSGSPLFSQIDSKAYGILSGGPSRDGLACDLSNQLEYTIFSPLQGDGGNHPGILDYASNATGITMNLITTAGG